MDRSICRMCKNPEVKKILDLGFTALADNFLNEIQLNHPETFYPLNVYFCVNCGLWQLGYVVPKELMFNEEYLYDSSTTRAGRIHFTSMGFDITDRFNLKPDSLIIDIGSNTGVLLSSFKSRNLRVLGIEPSSNIANLATKNGIDTIVEFFSSALATKIANQHGKANVITGTNIFAHIDDLDDFMNAVDILLTYDGVLVIEAPYLVNLIENLEYDTIYHEHLSYLALKPIMKFFKRFKMEVFDVEMQAIHGGTLRYYVGRESVRQVSKNVSDFLQLEEKKEIYSENRLKKFAEDVKTHRITLVRLLMDLKKEGKKIVGLSAPAKGNTLLNYCRIGPEILDYLTERNPLKIGKYTPGTHIPIYSDKMLIDDTPDYALILAWNFSDEIIRNNQEFKNKGGKFIVPIPAPKII